MDDKCVTLVADPYPPYQHEEGGAIKGIDYEVIASAFQAFGYNVQVRLLPWEECLRQLDDENADGIFQITRTPEREKSYVFSDLLRTAETAFFARSNQAIQLSETVDLREQLESLTLGVLTGYSYDPAIDSLDPTAKMEVDDQENLLLGLKEKGFDLAVMDSGVAAFLADKLGISGIKKVDGFAVTRELYVAFRPTRRDLVRPFNAQLEKLREQGTLQRIAKRYGLTRSI
jgi:polar amino acid transport system substrate-binding protein